MTALAANRDTPEMVVFQGGGFVALEYFLAASQQVWAGGIACCNAAGNVVPGSTSATLTAIGVFQEAKLDTTATATGTRVKAKPGVYRLGNSSAGDLITIAHRGTACYIVDDQTVAHTDNSGARSKAGVVVDVDSSGVWVAVGFNMFAT